MWSMTAVNSTAPAPPSSAPRDLTIMQPTDGDPQTLILNWQPPKYANGDIEGINLGIFWRLIKIYVLGILHFVTTDSMDVLFD